MAQELNQKSKIKNQKYILNICHLYPDLMDTYGDMGNIITIKKRCEWRGIETNITNVNVNNPLTTHHFDFYFFGGGQDKAQKTVAKNLHKIAQQLRKAIDKGAVLLSICGGYQLLQNYFKTKGGKKLEGLGIFDAHTIGSDDRMIQNSLIELNHDLKSAVSNIYSTNLQAHKPTSPQTYLIGFENHSGKTYLGKNVKPLGTVIKGAGNNGEDKTEGAIFKNAFGCYLHGSLLPKNPHFADYLISKALERRYGIVKLKLLDDTIEWQAHKQAIGRSFKSS